MAAIFVRTILLYALLTLLFRLMGRRQVGELDVSELISTLLLSEIASLPIDDPDIPLLFAVVPIVVIVCVEVALTALRVHSRRAKRLLGASPVLLIDRGRICQQTLGRMRITVEELFSECRQKGFGRPDEIEYAVLEENGKLSLLPKAKNSPMTPSDIGQKPE
ncbi:MAG: DUF421 domain-containing protein [Clostridia bacterium]|nr:DUF421 domain-containing protein [Clostridia bacterium]